jgi:hypothetical protein
MGRAKAHKNVVYGHRHFDHIADGNSPTVSKSPHGSRCQSTHAIVLTIVRCSSLLGKVRLHSRGRDGNSSVDLARPRSITPTDQVKRLLALTRILAMPGKPVLTKHIARLQMRDEFKRVPLMTLRDKRFTRIHSVCHVGFQ